MKVQQPIWHHCCSIRSILGRIFRGIYIYINIPITYPLPCTCSLTIVCENNLGLHPLSLWPWNGLVSEQDHQTVMHLFMIISASNNFPPSFYVRKQLLLSARLSHRNSVRPSHEWISQKRFRIGSPNLHRRVSGRL